ncbi:MAG TPA: DMT family transporter [Gaiellaceae bacterium]|nr:DMT family transporter [Gaiellaceae bacterium]
MALLAALITVVLWASAFVGIRAAGEDLSPGSLTLGRLAIGSVVLGAFVLTRSGRFPGRAQLPLLLVCGVLWFGLYNLALNEAERRVDAGTAAMLVNVGPILIAVLAGFLLREGFPRTLIVGCAIAFAGVVVIGLATSERGVAAGWGAALCVAAAAFYSAAVVAQKPLLAHASAAHVTWLACLIGVAVCVPFAPTLFDELGRADGSSIVWMVYLGIFPTAVAFTTWAYALARTTAGRMGATTYLVPPIAILLSWAILSETPEVLALLGGAFCLVGVLIARRPPRPSGAAQAELRGSTRTKLQSADQGG